MVDITPKAIEALLARLRLRGRQDREMNNHYARRMEIERIEAANSITALAAKVADFEANARFIAAARELVPALAARLAEVEAERDELRTAIFGGPDYSADLRNGNFSEMADTLHAARKGGLARAESAETAHAETKAARDEAVATAEKAKHLEALFSDLSVREAMGLSRDENARIDSWLPTELQFPAVQASIDEPADESEAA